MVEAYQYDSLADFINVLESPLRYESNFSSRERFKSGHMGGLAGLKAGDDWPEVKALWRNGWPEGIERMHRALGSMEPPRLKDRRRKAVWASEGDEFSRERLYAGHYEDPWRAVKRAVRMAPVPVRITVDVEAHVNVSHGDIFWRGAGAVMLAESLGAVGYPISVVATSGADGMGMQGGSYRQYVTVTAKAWDMPVYLPTLIACAGHGAFLRVGVFAHNIQFMPREHTGGMGYSIGTDTPDKLAELGFCEKNVRTVAMPRNIFTAEAAREWVERTVATLEGRDEE
jgi:hypothetical protein